MNANLKETHITPTHSHSLARARKTFSILCPCGRLWCRLNCERGRKRGRKARAASEQRARERAMAKPLQTLALLGSLRTLLFLFNIVFLVSEFIHSLDILNCFVPCLSFELNRIPSRSRKDEITNSSPMNGSTNLMIRYLKK